MKSALNNCVITPNDYLNYYFSQKSIKKEAKQKYNTHLVSLRSINKLSNQSQQTDKIPSINLNIQRIKSFDKKNNKKIQIFSKIKSFKKFNFSKTHYKSFNSNSEKEYHFKDKKVLKQFKKYRDIFQQNNQNYDVVKNAFIDDYKRNLNALNNYLTINYTKTENNFLDSNDQKINSNNNEYKPNFWMKKKKKVNKPIQLNFTFKENKKLFDVFNNDEKKKLNIIKKISKEMFNLNPRLEKERLRFKKDIFTKRTNNKIKVRKLVEYDCLCTPGNKEGKPKVNQDNYLIMNHVWNCKDIKIFGVFDGHGDNGALLTQEIKNMFQNYFSKNDNFENNHNVNEIYKYLINNKFQKIYELFQNINDKIHNKYISNNYCIQCGTTTNILISFYKKNTINKIISINLGDTKSISINSDNQIKSLNISHTPNITEERMRIEKNGGEVGRVEWTNGGPLRIWYQGKKGPGLSITRSFGDFDAEKLGVISVPDINEYNIDEEKINIIIIATEGLWTFLKNEKIMDIVLPYYDNNDVIGATKKLTEISNKLWEIKNPCEINDITIIVLYFK